MAKSYQIGSEYFAQQGYLKQRIKDLLQDPANFQNRLTNQKDIDFVQELIQYHPQAKIKIGSGVVDVWVDKNKGGTPSFYFSRTDGTNGEFSTVKCINNYPNKGI